MKESIAIAKEANKKKEFSPTRGDNNIQGLRNKPERQLGSLVDTIDGGTPSAESIADQLSGISTGGRAPVLLALQRTHGNRYTQRVVAGIQEKLKVGQPEGVYEQEADRVADEVMRMPEPGVQRQVEVEEEEEILQTKPLVDQITPLVQRQVEEEEEEEMLQTKSREDATSEVSNDLESQINTIKGSGRPLAESERSFFEPRFGADFSQVRVHTDAQATKSARAVNARAFTVGSDVAFGTGQYASGTHAGNHLLAHELTHIIQQGSSVPRLQHKIVDSQIVDTPEVEEASIRVLKRSSTTIQSMPALYSAKLIQRDADKPPIKTSNNTIDEQRENAAKCAEEAIGYGIKAKSFDAKTNERVEWRKLDLIFWVAYGDETKYDKNDIKKAVGGYKTFQDSKGKLVQRKVTDRLVDWCGIFAVYVLKSAGVPIGNWNSNLHSLLNPIKPETLPKKGDIAFKKKNGHMAVVTDVKEEENTTLITTINGNSDGGKILQKTDSIDKWLAFYDLSNPK